MEQTTTNFYTNGNAAATTAANTDGSATEAAQKRFSFFLPPASQVRPWRTMTVRQAYEYITMNVDAMQQTHRLRQCSDPKEHARLKRSCFAFATFSGVFAYRADAGLSAHSQLLCLDFDHVGNAYRLHDLKCRLIGDPMLHTRLLFTSPSGDGLKWVIDIDLSRCDHLTWFRAVRNYVDRTYHLLVDEKCCNVSRSCFLPHDASAYLGEERG